MGYWKAKVFPKIKTTFHFKKGSSSSASSIEEASDAASKAFDGSKEEVSREIEEKKEELRPKVLKIYNVCSEETQSAVRNPAPEVWVKNHSNADNINKFLENLVKIGFPGSKEAYYASTKHTPAQVSSSVIFIFRKVTEILPPVEKPTAEAPGAVEESSVKIEELVVAVPEMRPKAMVSEEEEEVVAPKALVSEDEVVAVAPKAELTKEEEDEIVPVDEAKKEPVQVVEMPKAVVTKEEEEPAFEIPKGVPTKEEAEAAPAKVAAEKVEIAPTVVEVPKEEVAGQIKEEVTKEDVAQAEVPKAEPTTAEVMPVKTGDKGRIVIN